MPDLYVVRRRRCWWERPDEMEEPYAVAVFATRPAAEAEAGHRSRHHLQRTLPRHNPFVVDWPTSDDAVRELASVTTLPPFALRDWLLDAGYPDTGPHAVPDAAAEFYDWSQWGHGLFDGVHDHDGTRWVLVAKPYWFPAGTLALLWEAMNLYPVYDVAGVDWHEPTGGRR